MTHATFHLWLIDLATAAAALETVDAQLGLFDDAERTRLAAISNPEVLRERLAAHRALRVVLELYAGRAVRRATVIRSRLGRPAIEGLDCDFSLSHAGSYALVGVRSGGAIGVDVERHRSVDFPPERKARILEGAVALSGHPLPVTEADHRLIAAWTRLEAFAKADGCGMARVLGRVGALGRGAAAEAYVKARPADDTRTVVIADVAVPAGYSAAVCLIDASASSFTAAGAQALGPVARPLPHAGAGIGGQLASPTEGSKKRVAPGAAVVAAPLRPWAFPSDAAAILQLLQRGAGKS